MRCELAFPIKADMMCVAALREEWLTRMENFSHGRIDCSAVEVMTAAGAQLVLSLAKGLAVLGGSVVLANVSPALRDDFLLLGLTEFLQEPPHHD